MPRTMPFTIICSMRPLPLCSGRPPCAGGRLEPGPLLPNGRRTSFDGADEEGLELAVPDLVHDQRHADLALLLEIRAADVGEFLLLLEERVLHLEARNRGLEEVDIVDRLLAHLLQRRENHLERIDLGAGLVIPLASDLGV